MRAVLGKVEKVILREPGNHGIIVIVLAKRADARSVHDLRLGIRDRQNTGRKQAGNEKSVLFHSGATLLTSS